MNNAPPDMDSVKGWAELVVAVTAIMGAAIGAWLSTPLKNLRQQRRRVQFTADHQEMIALMQTLERLDVPGRLATIQQEVDRHRLVIDVASRLSDEVAELKALQQLHAAEQREDAKEQRETMSELLRAVGKLEGLTHE